MPAARPYQEWEEQRLTLTTKAPYKPYDGKRPVRFDEGTLETELWARLRHRHLAKAAG